MYNIWYETYCWITSWIAFQMVEQCVVWCHCLVYCWIFLSRHFLLESNKRREELLQLVNEFPIVIRQEIIRKPVYMHRHLVIRNPLLMCDPKHVVRWIPSSAYIQRKLDRFQFWCGICTKLDILFTTSRRRSNSTNTRTQRLNNRSRSYRIIIIK